MKYQQICKVTSLCADRKGIITFGWKSQRPTVKKWFPGVQCLNMPVWWHGSVTKALRHDTAHTLCTFEETDGSD